MTRHGPVAGCLLVLSLFLAGCSSSEGKVSNLGGGGDGKMVGGMVIDDQQIPIQNATVVLTTRKESTLVARTTTDASGAFALGKIPFGEYVLGVQATGYNPISATLLILSGVESDFSNQRYALTPIPVIEPFHETLTATLNIQYSVAYQINGDFNQGCMVWAVTCNAYTYPNPNVLFRSEDPKDTPWRTVVLEVIWTPTSPVCAKSLAVDVYNPDAPNTADPSTSNPHYWTNYPSTDWSTSSPIVMVIPRDGEGNAQAVNHPDRISKNGGEMLVRGNWTIRNFPPAKGVTNQVVDFNCVTDQKYDYFWTTFYLEGAPAEFAARPV